MTGSDSSRVKKLTKRAVDAAAPASQRYIVWDADLPGFGLRVEPSGRKTFVARYRAGGGRNGTLRQETIGRYGTLTSDEARALARRTLGSAAGGADPVGEKRKARQRGITISEVCDWYLKEAEAGRLLGRHGRPIKPSTLSTDRARIYAHVRPLLGSKSADTLDTSDFEKMQADIAAGLTARAVPEERPRGGIPTGGGGTAARTLGMIRAILEHATRLKVIAANPARGARKAADRKRTRRLSLDHLRKLGAAMRDLAAEGENPTGLAAIRLILLTGFRRGEALGLRPIWVMDSGGVDFPDTKAGAQVRPIGKAAVKLLKKLSGEGQEWAFPADRGDGHFVGLPRVLERVCKRAKLTDVTPHTLRHTFASVAGDLDYSELTIAGLLGHTAGSITSGYVHLDRSLVAAADQVAGIIASALDGKESATVVRLRNEAG